MNVVLADIEADALRAQVQRLEQEERNVLGVVTDTMRREALEELRDRTIEQFGNVHILINNAGVAGGDDAGPRPDGTVQGSWQVPDETWEWIMGVNFWGVLYGIQVFVPHMLEHGEDGHIVNTASLAGLMPGGGAYSVSKHAVLTLTEGLYDQFQAIGANLSASVLCPGFVNTNIGHADRNRPQEFGGTTERTTEQEQILELLLGGGMDPAEVADVVYDSIVEQRCYILPHPAWDDVVRGRIEHVLARGAPISVDIEEMMRLRAAGQQV